MPVLFRFMSPPLANARNGGPTTFLDFNFSNLPCADPLVTVQLWPTNPDNVVTNAQAFINNSTIDVGVRLVPVQVNGQAFTFRLGGNAAETPGQMNSVRIQVTVTDGIMPTIINETVNYYRMADPVMASPFPVGKKKASGKKAKSKGKK